MEKHHTVAADRPGFANPTKIWNIVDLDLYIFFSSGKWMNFWWIVRKWHWCTLSGSPGVVRKKKNHHIVPNKCASPFCGWLMASKRTNLISDKSTWSTRRMELSSFQTTTSDLFHHVLEVWSHFLIDEIAVVATPFHESDATKELSKELWAEMILFFSTMVSGN